MTLIDDFTKKVWVFIMKHKNEAFNKFKGQFLKQENKREKCIKHLRTDNGFENMSDEFQKYVTIWASLDTKLQQLTHNKMGQLKG